MQCGRASALARDHPAVGQPPRHISFTNGSGFKNTHDKRAQRPQRDPLGWPPKGDEAAAEEVAAPRRRAGGGTMPNPQMVMYEEEFNQIQNVVDRLVKDANAKVVFIVDKNGQLIAASGDVDNLDTTSLASLTAGNIAATGGMAKLLKENEFATQFHEGEKANIHIQLVGNRVILVVIFDSKSSLGLVRLRVRKASEELNHIFEALLKKVQEPGTDSPFAEITDEDIDNLFND
jgi:predicted regulator of Ras-like GTPase activity (Roadblock/LC7/MglB family)